MSELPVFPVDDATLLAVEHALDAALTYERPEDNTDFSDEGPFLVGADYSLDRLLDFMSGTLDDDGVTDLGVTRTAFGELPTSLDERPHYTERDIIRSLIGEVRRLRAGGWPHADGNLNP